MADNLPPADELFDVREQLKALKARESDLRSLMLSDPSARTGNRYAVEIKEVTSTRTDIKEMRKLHPDIVEQFTFPLAEQRVELHGINEDGELTSLRRKPDAPVKPHILHRRRVKEVIREWVKDNPEWMRDRPGADPRLPPIPPEEFKRRLNAKESLI
jgi:hypothetical protein